MLLAESGSSEPERWMGTVRLGAACDLVERLPRAGFSPVLAVVQNPGEANVLSALGAEILDGLPQPFRFGRVLSWVAEKRGLASLAYFGGTSVPLAAEATLDAWRIQSASLPPDGSLVNNIHSTDWAIVRDSAVLRGPILELEADNALGWTLRESLGLPVAVPRASAAAHADIDTPGDLALLRGHPDIGPGLRRALEPFPADLGRRADGVARLLRTPASSLALIGRVSAEVWLDLVRRTQLWVRVYAEERGMRASGRQSRGEVQSLIGDLVESLGPAGFVRRLGEIAGGALWDTRVWMARGGRWPSEADRMAADLGWTDQIEAADLRALTEAVVDSGLPVVTGGHGVVAGGLRAMLECMGE